MPVDDRARNLIDQAADETARLEPEDDGQEERKERGSAQIAAAGVAGAAVIGTAAGMAADRLTPDSGEEEAEVGEEPVASIDVFDDVETAEDASATAQPSGERITTVSQPLAPTPAEMPIAQPEQVSEDPRRSTARTDAPAPSPAPSSVADTTVIAATEAGTTGVSGQESTVPTAPLINRPVDDPAPPAVETVDIPEVPETSGGAGFVPDPAQVNVPVIEGPASEPADEESVATGPVVELDEEGSSSSDEQEVSSTAGDESSSSDDAPHDDHSDQDAAPGFEMDAPDDDPVPVHHDDDADYDAMPPHEQDEDDYHQDVAPPHHEDVVEDEVEQDYDDYYYSPFPGNKGYQHPQDLYGNPELVSSGHGGDVYLYKGEAGQDYATIIRDESGNETITWWYGDLQDAHVVYQVRVTHDGHGDYTEQIMSYPVGEVDLLLGNIYVNDEPRQDPDLLYGKDNAAETIEPHVIIRTWTDNDGNMVMKRIHRDGSGKIEISYGDGVYVVYEGGEYTYYQDGELIDGDEPDAIEPEPYVGEPGAYLPPTAPDEFEINGETYPNPEQDDSYTYLKTEGPFALPEGSVTNHHYVDENGYLVIIGVHSDGEYHLMYGDPNTPLAGWDMRVVMQPDGSYSALPGYLDDGPTDASGEEPDISAEPRTYYSADYVHPEDQYPDGPTQTVVSGGVQVDMYPDATVYTREDGSQVIVWMAVDENGNPEMVEAPIPTDGAPVLVGDTGPDNVQAWDMAVEVDADGGVHFTTLPPEAWRVIPGDLDDGGAYLDPDTSGMPYEQAYRGIDPSASVVRV